MSCVFSFAFRRRTKHARKGRIVQVDATIRELGVEDDAGVKSVAFDARDATFALQELVKRGGKVVWLVCEHSDGVANSFDLMVDEASFDEKMARGEVECEEELIALASAVWREARLPARPAPQLDARVPVVTSPTHWSPSFHVYSYQVETVSWMLNLEAGAPRPLVYDGNLKITSVWYVDTEDQSLTRDASKREAALTGGICADGLGCGKTATALLLAQQPVQPREAASGLYESSGTLFLLPINLIGQWKAEKSKFLPDAPALWISEVRDLKNVTLRTLCAAKMVFTTFELLRSNQAYQTLVDDALNGRPRERAALGAWARRPGRTTPVIEAVRWKRIVVDEMHQVFESPRDEKVLRMFRYDFLWGLTATPVVEGDGAQSLYLLLQREKAHHPSLLSEVLRCAVRAGGAQATFAGSQHLVELVNITAEERVAERDAHVFPVAEQVRRLTRASEVEDAARLKLRALRAQEGAAERNLSILERASEDLQSELERCTDADAALATREACESQARDVHKAREVLTRLQRKRAAWELRSDHACARVSQMKTDRTCHGCGEAGTLFGPTCLHLVCSSCAAAHEGACPICHAQLVAVPLESGDSGGSKMKQISKYLSSLSPDEGVLLFVQFRSLLRQTRSFLRNLSFTVHTLDGNTRARSAALAALSAGGVLLLCLEDGFAGLHLPGIRHVVFAHAIVGSVDRVRALEQQAISRCLRPGQTNQVIVKSFVCAATEEYEVFELTH